MRYPSTSLNRRASLSSARSVDAVPVPSTAVSPPAYPHLPFFHGIWSKRQPGGPFSEIAASDIFINSVYLGQPIPPFVTTESLSKPGRKLRVICDVSCDPRDPNNPIPLYEEYSTFVKPTLPVPARVWWPERRASNSRVCFCPVSRL